jgi:hypothetical protein
MSTCLIDTGGVGIGVCLALMCFYDAPGVGVRTKRDMGTPATPDGKNAC